MEEMCADEMLFFNGMPQMLPVYERLKEKLMTADPSLRIKVSKTQISFANRYIFAMVSLPWRKIKGWPEQYLLVSFGLPEQKQSPRIAQATEAYRGRWTHHVVVETVGQIDDELLSWLDEAAAFARAKGRKK